MKLNRSWSACCLSAALLCCHVAYSAETSLGPSLKSGWSETQLAEFKAGCTNGVINPARRDYALAAAKAENASPKPFPEAELRASADPMCACLGLRIAQTWDYAEFIASQGAGVKPMMQEAMAGGRCKPEGLLGVVIDHGRQ